MSLDDDFPDDADKLKQELERFSGKCYYDKKLKKIVYYSSQEALDAYIHLEIDEMNEYKRIESEKAGRDLGDRAMIDWCRQFAKTFAEFWQRTHAYIPPKDFRRRAS